MSYTIRPQSAQFKMGISDINQFEQWLADHRDIIGVSFVGRSNVGKSSLINALVSKKIAITSKTPGRTRQLNFFSVGDKLNLVDMPGFGYAKVSKAEIGSWEKLIYRYFANRANLKKAFFCQTDNIGNILDASIFQDISIYTRFDHFVNGCFIAKHGKC